MSVFTSVLSCLFSLVLCAPLPVDGEGCRKCEHRGVLLCSNHTEEIHTYEKDVLFCSTVAACEDCAGALLVDCPKCDGGPDDHLIAPRQKEVADWMATHELSKFMERPLPMVETDRYQLLIDTGPLKLNKRKSMDGHLLMHLVARDVMEVERLVAEHYGLVDQSAAVEGETALEASMRRNYSNKMRMWFWSTLEDHQKVMRKYMGNSSTGDFKLLGGRPVFSAWTEKEMATVRGVRSACTHNAAHMLISNLRKPLWVGDIGGGWFDAGSGHWYEYEIHGRSTNYCIEEATVPLEYHGGVWRVALRKWIMKEDTYFLPRLMPMNTGAMTLPEQAICWSFYEWLVLNHQPALPKILEGLKAKQETRAVLKETLGMTVMQAEDAWRAWVVECYPIKGDELREPNQKKKRGRK